MGNYTSEIEGCILVGGELGADGCSIAAGTSAQAYSELRRRFYGSEKPTSTPEKSISVELIGGPGVLDGHWESTDADRRWDIMISGQSIVWTERSSSGRHEHKLEVKEQSLPLRIERANDVGVLGFIGFNSEMQAEILRRQPLPSFMILTLQDCKLVGQWSGLVATKDKQGKFHELKQPGATPPKNFEFRTVEQP
jgi:hypothetical protein